MKKLIWLFSILMVLGAASLSYAKSVGFIGPTIVRGSGTTHQQRNDFLSGISPGQITDMRGSTGTSGYVLKPDANGNPFWTNEESGGTSFDQDLNTTDEVAFSSVTPQALYFSPVGSQVITAATQAVGVTGYAILYLSSDADYTLTTTPTFVGGRPGQVILLHNDGLFDIDFQDNSALAGSSVFQGRSPGTLHADATMVLVYDSQVSGFRIFANPNTAILGANATTEEVRADEALSAGELVHITGWHVGSGRPTVEKADKDDSSKSPAFGFIVNALANNQNGEVIILGEALNLIDTSGTAVEDGVWLSNTGGVQFTRPSTGCIQKMGEVARVGNANASAVFVFGAGRCNDTPHEIKASGVSITMKASDESGISVFKSDGTKAVEITDTGSDFSGNSTSANAPTDNSHVATKKYVDDNAGNPNISETGASVFVTPDTGSCDTCFAVGDGAGATLLTVNDIGNTAIKGKLDVNRSGLAANFGSGTNESNYIRIRDSASGAIFGYGMASPFNGPVIQASTDHSIRFYINGGGNFEAGSLAMIINTDGSFGFGTSRSLSGATINAAGGVSIGQVGSNPTDTGVTSFVAIASGVSPTGSLTSGAMFYVTSNEMWVNGGDGTHTKLSSIGLNPFNGKIEPYREKYNVYVGKGYITWDSGQTEVYTVPVSDWVVAYTAAQKRAFLQNEVETTATFRDEDIITKTGGTYTTETRYRAKNDGTIESYQEGITTDILEITGTKKVLNERLDKITGKLYRKRTEGGFVVNTVSLCDKWAGVAPFIKAAQTGPTGCI